MNLSVLISMILFSLVSSGRTIVKNPTQLNVEKSQIVRVIELGNNKYYVLNRFEKDLNSFAKSTGAEAAFIDPKIQLIQPQAPVSNKATQAWHPQALKYDKLPANRGGKNIVVAVLDTGVDHSHPALNSKMWVNQGEIPGNEIDDDQNGYIDDVYGFDFTSYHTDPMDWNGHGTHCAGIISSKEDAASGAIGVAPDAKIMAVKIIGSNESFLTDAVEGIKYAADNGADIMSNSWRVYSDWTDYYTEEGRDFLRDAIEYADSKGVLFVAAAGNEGRNNDNHLVGMRREIIPAGYENLRNMIVVGASTKRGFWNWSNHGTQSVSVVAPGADIISTYPNNRWRSLTGTSMATPIVSGALARAMSGYMDPYNALKQIGNTADRSEPWVSKTQNGHIDLFKFLSFPE